MKKNLRSMIESWQESPAQILVDMNQYDLIESTGMKPDLAHKKSAHMSAAWRLRDLERVVIPMGGSDLSGVRYLTFSVCAAGAQGASFRLTFSNSQTGENTGGYETIVCIAKDGWNDYRLEIPFLHSTGKCTGWNDIGSIIFEVLNVPTEGRSPVLYIDSFYVYEKEIAPVYARMPELKGAAVFSKTGNFAIVDRKRIPNSIDDSEAKPFEEDGILWLPMAPVAAGMAFSCVADNRALTLSFTYRRKKYVFAASSDCVTVDGVEQALGFFPRVRGGMLFFPADYVREFFRWRQIFVDGMGLIILSNRKNIFQSGRDSAILWQLVAATTFHRPEAERVLSDLRRRFSASRGRLLLSHDELMQLRRRAKEEPELAGYLKSLKAEYGTTSVAFKSEPIVPAKPRTAQALADDLALSAENIIAFSTLYRVTGDKKYCERAALECEALAEFKDWNAQLMSSVGTIALAVAICYDWCHHVWSEGRKAIVERALLRNAMRVGLECYDGKRHMWIAGGTAAAVVNAGMLATALALADIYPETALKLVDRVLRNVEACFASYAPDGGYSEGTWAWSKSTRALALVIAMLQKACGNDYGFAAAPGFSATGYFAIATETPIGMWNFHNSGAWPNETSVLYWMSTQYGDPTYAYVRRQQILSNAKSVTPLDLLFYTPVDESFIPALPQDTVYRKAGLAIMRSGWGSEDTFVGLHGGANDEVNGDLDAGSVILDMAGVRFFAETGGIETLPVMMRRRAAGQNTVVVNPAAEPAPDQEPHANAKIVEMKGREDRIYAVVDMTSTNKDILRGKRGVMLTDNRTTVVIQDELVLQAPGEILWTVYTPAEVEILNGGKVAKLTVNDKVLKCQIGGFGKAKFAAEKVENSNVPFNPTLSLTRLYIKAEVKERLRLSVAAKVIGEGDDFDAKLYEVAPISTWGDAE